MSDLEYQRVGNQIKALLSDFSRPKALRMIQRMHRLETDGNDFPEWLDDLWVQLTDRIEEDNASDFQEM